MSRPRMPLREGRRDPHEGRGRPGGIGRPGGRKHGGPRDRTWQAAETARAPDWHPPSHPPPDLENRTRGFTVSTYQHPSCRETVKDHIFNSFSYLTSFI